jgi:glycosyltransferase involved in cell wall biosynthesis
MGAWQGVDVRKYEAGLPREPGRGEAVNDFAFPGGDMPATHEHRTETDAPGVSVGLPVYNAERYLRIAIESILNQTLRDWELVICDNASTDGTGAICREYAARDPRIRYHRLPANIGAANNFRRVFELSRGRYFKWIACDDFCGPEFLERCVQVLDESPDTVLCTTKASMIDQDGRVIERYAERQDLPMARASDRFIASRDQDGWCIAVYGLVRADTLRRTAVMGNYAGSDAVLLGELSLYGRFAEVPEYLLFRRIHPGAYSHEVNLEKMRDFYTPSKKRGTALVFRSWRHLFEYLRAVIRAPLPFGERLRLFAYILRMMWWRKGDLAAEIVAGLRSVIGRDNA